MTQTDPTALQRLRSTSFQKPLVATVVAALAVALVVWMAQRPKAPARSRTLGAELELSAGEVTVREGERAFGAPSGTPLATGSRVHTAKGSRALVRTGDGAAIFLRGESEIGLDPPKIELLAGEIWLDVPRLEGAPTLASTGNVTVSASNAGLDLRRAGDEVWVYVARGLAVLTSPEGRAEINAGEQAIVKPGARPAVAPVAFFRDWTGGMADSHSASRLDAAGRVYGVDPFGRPGAPARPLAISRQAVRAVIRDGVAETEVDQTFANPDNQQVEGWYWFTVPPGASVTSFALETDGVLVEGEVVERQKAAAKYAAAVRASRDPALLEWVDGRSYRARIFPIPAAGTRRVVLKYLELLPASEGKTRYAYPLGSSDGIRFGEFALSVDLGDEGKGLEIATSLDARIEDGGRRVSMRRSEYLPRADFEVEMAKGSKAGARAYRFQAGADEADYVLLRYVPEVDWSTPARARGDVVLVVDTSAAGDDSARRAKAAAAEAVLRSLSEDDRFAIVALDVRAAVLYPKEGLAPASEDDIAHGLEKLSEHAAGGATDLGAMFEPALGRLHGAEQPAIVYVGDGTPTAGEMEADALVDRLRRSLSNSRARLFCVGIGGEARHDLMRELTRAAGGQYFRVDSAEEATAQALRLTGAIKAPTITELALDLGAGLDQPFSSVTRTISRGEEVVWLARTHHPLPPRLKVKGRLGGKDFSAEPAIDVKAGIVSSLVPRLWASEYVHRLLGGSSEVHRAKVLELGLAYGIITPYTSSLALDSEAAYAAQGIIRRRSAVRGVHLSSLTSLTAGAFAVTAGCDAPSRMVGSAPAASEMSAPSEKTVGHRYGVEERGSAPPAEPVLNPVAADDEPARRASIEQALGAGEAVAGTPLSAAAAGRPDNLRAAKAAPRPLAMAAGGSLKGVTPSTPPPAPPAANRVKTADLEFAPLALGRCSDAASRPLAERRLLWKGRLSQVTSSGELIVQYRSAYTACEINSTRDQLAFLEILQASLDTEQAVESVLAYFARDPDAQSYLARAILRRTTEARIIAAVSRVLFGDRIDWVKLDRELYDLRDPERRLEHLRAALLAAPSDPAGAARWVRLLADAGRSDEALAYGRRLREQGLFTPTIVEELGDVLAAGHLDDEAIRTYSELVEFDPASPAPRRRLGDIYLRHGWYAEAYHQYKSLLTISAKEPSDWIRLASAAAGAGRIDEALRIERDVAADAGRPGPDDPRYFARLWSAARLALLLDRGAGDGAWAKDDIAQKLKSLQLFAAPATLAMVTWNDLSARLLAERAGGQKPELGESSADAARVGLFAVTVAAGGAPDSWSVRFQADRPDRAVPFTFISLSWDGRAFAVKTQQGELLRGAKVAML